MALHTVRCFYQSQARVFVSFLELGVWLSEHDGTCLYSSLAFY